MVGRCQLVHWRRSDFETVVVRDLVDLQWDLMGTAMDGDHGGDGVTARDLGVHGGRLQE